jgi:hypothetical protein
MTIPRPLTKKQLAEVVGCYASAFPGWQLVGGVCLVRTHGPVLQQIGFEALRSGAYRPAMGIEALPLPTAWMLPQFLDIKHRQTLLRQHASKWRDVVVAMERQFRPSVRAPLDLREVRALCQQEARETTSNLCMLAILSASLGEGERALAYCDRAERAPPPTLAPRLDWERRHVEFARQLRAAIEIGDERRFLDEASGAGLAGLDRPAKGTAARTAD